MKNVAVILAGGSGTRLGGELPKQFLKVAGKKIIEHTIEAFEQNEFIDEIAVVCNPLYMHLLENLLIDGGYKKVKKILNGGKERSDSSLAAINAYTEDVNLIFHDAVRPLVSQRIINDCIKALEKYDAVDVAIKTTDTIIQVRQKEIENIPDRSILNNGQTPQCFKRALIANAYEKALQDPHFKTTDDCGVVKKYMSGTPIYVVDGEPLNMKVTYEEDLFLVDKLFQMKRFDISQKLNELSSFDFSGTVTVVFGASSGIGKCIAQKIKSLNGKVYGFSRSEGSVNIQNPDDVKSVLKKVFDAEGKINFVVNTAGILSIQPLDTMDYKDITDSVAINYLGSIIVAKESFEYLKRSNGCLLLFTSSSYTRGRMLYALYSSAKAAVVNLMQALNEEWHSSNIRINCICPERTKTPMRTKNFGNEPEDSLCSAEKVADYSIAALISKVSGEVIDVRK